MVTIIVLYLVLKAKQAGIKKELISKRKGIAIRPKPIGPPPLHMFLMVKGIKTSKFDKMIRKPKILFTTL